MGRRLPNIEPCFQVGTDNLIADFTHDNFLSQSKVVVRRLTAKHV